ncbi:MAG: hypothetical protein R6W06_03670, partial [Prochlorococcaceae cyanobacterium]
MIPAAPILEPSAQSTVGVIATANGSEWDGSPLIFSFSRTDSSATPLSEPLTIAYQLLGNASAGEDYSGASEGTITFAAGATTASLSLPV